MGDPRVKILIKALIDLLYFALVFAVYLTSVFSYMTKFYIGTTDIIYKTTKYNLDSIVIASYSQFEDHFCGMDAEDISEVCDHREDFENAGIVFIVFSSLAHLGMAYGMLNLMGMLCGCTLWGIAKYEITHYIYPPVYGVSVFLWIIISKIFSLDPPTKNSADDMTVEVGLVLMFAAFLVGTTSTIYFFWNRKDMRAILLVTKHGFSVAPPDD